MPYQRYIPYTWSAYIVCSCTACKLLRVAPLAGQLIYFTTLYTSLSSVLTNFLKIFFAKFIERVASIPCEGNKDRILCIIFWVETLSQNKSRPLERPPPLEEEAPAVAGGEGGFCFIHLHPSPSAPPSSANSPTKCKHFAGTECRGRLSAR